MCKERFVTSGSSDTLTLAAIIPVFHQVEEVMEVKQKLLVEMIQSSVSAWANQSITGKLQVCESSPVPHWEQRARAGLLGSAQLRGDQEPQHRAPGGDLVGKGAATGIRVKAAAFARTVLHISPWHQDMYWRIILTPLLLQFFVSLFPLVWY